MSEQKMGTHYVREIAENFVDAAAGCAFPEVKEKLLSLAGTLEPLATKLYFKTQKGTEDMERLASELSGIKGALSASTDARAAADWCNPHFTKLDQIIHHVQTMKVRMT